MSESEVFHHQDASGANQPQNVNHPGIAPSADDPGTITPTSLFSINDIWFAQVLVLILLACITGYVLFRVTFPNPELTVLREPGKPYAYVIDVNEADWIHWMLLPGIGEKLAKKIIKHRMEHGPFHAVDDLLSVNGIGNITLETLRPHLICKPVNGIHSSPTTLAIPTQP